MPAGFMQLYSVTGHHDDAKIILAKSLQQIPDDNFRMLHRLEQLLPSWKATSALQPFGFARPWWYNGCDYVLDASSPEPSADTVAEATTFFQVRKCDPMLYPC